MTWGQTTETTKPPYVSVTTTTTATTSSSSMPTPEPTTSDFSPRFYQIEPYKAFWTPLLPKKCPVSVEAKEVSPFSSEFTD